MRNDESSNMRKVICFLMRIKEGSSLTSTPHNIKSTLTNVGFGPTGTKLGKTVSDEEEES